MASIPPSAGTQANQESTLEHHEENAPWKDALAKTVFIACSIIGVIACYSVLPFFEATIIVLSGALLYHYFTTGSCCPDCCNGSANYSSTRSYSTYSTTTTPSYPNRTYSPMEEHTIGPNNSPFAATSFYPTPFADESNTNIELHTTVGDDLGYNPTFATSLPPPRSHSFFSSNPSPTINSVPGGGTTSSTPLPPPKKRSFWQTTSSSSHHNSSYKPSAAPPIPRGANVRPGSGFTSTSAPPIPRGANVRPGSGFTSTSAPPIPRGANVVPGSG